MAATAPRAQTTNTSWSWAAFGCSQQMLHLFLRFNSWAGSWRVPLCSSFRLQIFFLEQDAYAVLPNEEPLGPDAMAGTGSPAGWGTDNRDRQVFGKAFRWTHCQTPKTWVGANDGAVAHGFVSGALRDERTWVGSCAHLWRTGVKSWLQNVNVLKILLGSNFRRNLPWQSVVNHANMCRSRVNKTNRWENNESKWIMPNSMVVRCVFPVSSKGLSLVISLTPPSINCLDV